MKSLINSMLKKMKLAFSKSPGDATAIFLKRMFPSCPICGCSTQNHEYSLVLSAEFNEEFLTRLNNLLGNKKIRELLEAMSDNPWNPVKDGINIFAVNCNGSSGNRISLLLVFNPIALDRDLYLVDSTIFSKFEFRHIVNEFDLNLSFRPLK